METILTRIAIAAPVLGKHIHIAHVLAATSHLTHHIIEVRRLIPRCVVMFAVFPALIMEQLEKRVKMVSLYQYWLCNKQILFYWLLVNISHTGCSDEIHPHNWLCWSKVTGCMDMLLEVANQIRGKAKTKFNIAFSNSRP